MDYLEWELERQRAALAALLGGGTENGETVLREKKRRSPMRRGNAPPGAPGDTPKAPAASGSLRISARRAGKRTVKRREPGQRGRR